MFVLMFGVMLSIWLFDCLLVGLGCSVVVACDCCLVLAVYLFCIIVVSICFLIICVTISLGFGLIGLLFSCDDVIV